MCVAGVTGTLARGCKGNRQVTEKACAQRFCNLTCGSCRKEQVHLNNSGHILDFLLQNEKQKDQQSSVGVIIPPIPKIALSLVQKDLLSLPLILYHLCNFLPTFSHAFCFFLRCFMKDQKGI